MTFHSTRVNFFLCHRQLSRDKKDLQMAIRTHKERNSMLERLGSELNQELQEVMEQRIALEIQLEHLKPFSSWSYDWTISVGSLVQWCARDSNHSLCFLLGESIVPCLRAEGGGRALDLKKTLSTIVRSKVFGTHVFEISQSVIFSDLRSKISLV